MKRRKKIRDDRARKCGKKRTIEDYPPKDESFNSASKQNEPPQYYNENRRDGRGIEGS